MNNKTNQIYQNILARRSVRLFKQKSVSQSLIKKVINAARVAPSAANLQPLEYLVITDTKKREEIFSHMHWAGYVAPKRIPGIQTKPTVYIFILINKNKLQFPDGKPISADTTNNFLSFRDTGIAAENILLALAALGLGGCLLISINRKVLRRILNIPRHFILDSLIAAGYPDEKPVLETDSDNIRYWLDKNNRLHVPKRELKDILYFNET